MENNYSSQSMSDIEIDDNVSLQSENPVPTREGIGYKELKKIRETPEFRRILDLLPSKAGFLPHIRSAPRLAGGLLVNRSLINKIDLRFRQAVAYLLYTDQFNPENYNHVIRKIWLMYKNEIGDTFVADVGDVYWSLCEQRSQYVKSYLFTDELNEVREIQEDEAECATLPSKWDWLVAGQLFVWSLLAVLSPYPLTLFGYATVVFNLVVSSVYTFWQQKSWTTVFKRAWRKIPIPQRVRNILGSTRDVAVRGILRIPGVKWLICRRIFSILGSLWPVYIGIVGTIFATARYNAYHSARKPPKEGKTVASYSSQYFDYLTLATSSLTLFGMFVDKNEALQYSRICDVLRKQSTLLKSAAERLVGSFIVIEEPLSKEGNSVDWFAVNNGDGTFSVHPDIEAPPINPSHITNFLADCKQAFDAVRSAFKGATSQFSIFQIGLTIMAICSIAASCFGVLVFVYFKRRYIRAICARKVWLPWFKQESLETLQAEGYLPLLEREGDVPTLTAFHKKVTDPELIKKDQIKKAQDLLRSEGLLLNNDNNNNNLPSVVVPSSPILPGESLLKETNKVVAEGKNRQNLSRQEKRNVKAGTSKTPFLTSGETRDRRNQYEAWVREQEELERMHDREDYYDNLAEEYMSKNPYEFDPEQTGDDYYDDGDDELDDYINDAYESRWEKQYGEPTYNIFGRRAEGMKKVVLPLEKLVRERGIDQLSQSSLIKNAVFPKGIYRGSSSFVMRLREKDPNFKKVEFNYLSKISSQKEFLKYILGKYKKDEKRGVVKNPTPSSSSTSTVKVVVEKKEKEKEKEDPRPIITAEESVFVLNPKPVVKEGLAKQTRYVKCSMLNCLNTIEAAVDLPVFLCANHSHCSHLVDSYVKPLPDDLKGSLSLRPQGLNPLNRGFNNEHFRPSIRMVYAMPYVKGARHVLNCVKLGRYIVTCGSEMHVPDINNLCVLGPVLPDGSQKEYPLGKPVRNLQGKNGGEVSIHCPKQQPPGWKSLTPSVFSKSLYYMHAAWMTDSLSPEVVFLTCPTFVHTPYGTGYGENSSEFGACGSVYISTQSLKVEGIHIAGGKGITQMVLFTEDDVAFLLDMGGSAKN